MLENEQPKEILMQAKMDKTKLIFGESKPEFINWLVCKEGHVDVVEIRVNNYWFEFSKCEWNDSFWFDWNKIKIWITAFARNLTHKQKG